MTFMRRNLSTLPAWDPIIVNYAKAVTKMQARAITDATSWRWQAAVHGFHAGLAAPGEALPSTADRETYWNQCQHGSWYFLPWHRGYLSAFERIVRAAIDGSGANSWALPYWDLANPAWQKVRPEFCAKKLPDGSPNPLYVTKRRQGFETGNVGIDPRGVALDRLLVEPSFGGSGGGGGTGFGGPETDFFHGPGATGGLEGGIHNYIHGRVGGSDGFMSSFEEAGLDPLFWLHHCNIDRLWEVWRTRDAAHKDPTANRWLAGPSAKKFKVRISNTQDWTFTSRDVAKSQAAPLDYVYEDISDPLAGTPTPPHLRGFVAAPARGGMAMVGRGQGRTRVLGALTPGVTLGPGRASTKVAIERPRPTRRQSLTGPSAERILLNLENITGVDRGQAYRVYVNLPDDGNPHTDERHFVGMMSLFGIDAASAPDGTHAGNGLTYVFDITELMRQRSGDSEANDEVTVDFVADEDDARAEAAKVGRISIVRETK